MDDLAKLCQACGLCCDGSLFGRAQLDADEVETARKHRLDVVASGGSFEQPCNALVDGACTIYDERPRSCRRFVCRLYRRLENEGGALDGYLERVERVRELIAAAQRETSDVVDPELAKLMDEDFARA